MKTIEKQKTMKTYNCIYDKVLSTDSKRFKSYAKALAYFTKKLWKHQIFTLVESEFVNGNRTSTQKTYKVYNGVPELIS